VKMKYRTVYTALVAIPILFIILHVVEHAWAEYPIVTAN